MKSLLLLLLLLLTLLPATYAQPSGVLHGVVTDESGALVPGAKVTVSNAAGPVKSATAGNDGSYSIAGLDAGNLHGPGLLARLAADQTGVGRISLAARQPPRSICNWALPLKSRK